MSLFLNMGGISTFLAAAAVRNARTVVTLWEHTPGAGSAFSWRLLGLSVIKSAYSISIFFGTFLVVLIHLFIHSPGMYQIPAISKYFDRC